MTADRQRTRFADVLARLQRDLVSGRRAADGSLRLAALPGLRARTTDDFTLAVADAWAVLAEILGFHSARHDEQARLDLATELRSLIELSRLIGYQPDPGLAASAPLAFTIDDAGATPQITIPAGTAVTSLPGPGERSVTFETVEAVMARPSWNVLQPRLSVPQTFRTAPDFILLAGTSTNVVPGDGVVVRVGTLHAFGVVTAVRVRSDDPTIPSVPGRPGWTRLDLAQLPAEQKLPPGDAATTVGFTPSQPARGPLLESLSPAGTTTLDSEQLRAAGVNAGFTTPQVFAALGASRALPDYALVFRAQAGIFGGAAPDLNSLPPSTKQQLSGAAPAAGAFRASPATVWADSPLSLYPGAAAGAGATRVLCDTVVRTARPGPLVLRDGDTWRLLTATAVDTESLSVFTVSGRTTVLTVSSGDLSAFNIRRTAVYLAGELLPLAPAQLTSSLPDHGAFGTIELADWLDGLVSGQRVAVTGMSATHPGLAVAHVSTVHKVHHLLSPTGSTSLVLDDPVPDTLLRASVRINANVAIATQGESRSEVLGSGNGQLSRSRYALSGHPLTYRPGASGSAPELTVYVDGIARQRVAALLDPAETGYVVRQNDQQISTIEFGSPLPTGVINVRADYRVGLGAGAAVKAGQLSMLASRPPGVRAVVNPLPAAGGADHESVEDARRNAPVSVRALDRVVSLVDYADFARAYPGIAKAAAKAVTVGDRPGVEVSVAGAHGDITPDAEVYRGLLAAFAASGDELVPVRLLACQRVAVRVGAALRLDPKRIAADVLLAATSAVAAALSFDARDLGQVVSASEIVEVLQAVPGVVSANIRVLCRLVGGLPENSVTYQPLLRPDPPVGLANNAAVLLTLDAASLELQAVTS